MSFEVDGVPYEDRDEAVIALVEEFICDTGDNDTDAVAKAFNAPEATAKRITEEYGAAIGGGENAGQDEIVAALKRLEDEGLG